MLAEDELRDAVLLVFANKQVCVLLGVAHACHFSTLLTAYISYQSACIKAALIPLSTAICVYMHVGQEKVENICSNLS